jgi:glutamate synthase domain-containing protein 2
MRKHFFASVVFVHFLVGVGAFFQPEVFWAELVFGPLTLIGLVDIFQKKHTIRRNFPVIGHFRYIFEAIRPEINQYFVESNSDGMPFSRESRSIVYQRGKKELDTLPFGTQRDVYAIGYEWALHSLSPVHVDPKSMRVVFGGPQCKHPYTASILNVSAMSYGSLSKNAILALNGGAKLGGFAHNTGEGGLSPYHLEPGGDIIWQIGTGYFSCRTPEGNFSEPLFKERAILPQVKMIEIKLSQGAKPSHGGILPAAKVSHEISVIRGVPMGKDVISPPAHSTFTTPFGFLEWLQRLRELSGGKPVGFKLCVGKRREFIAIAKAIVHTGIFPDFITVDGGEGGTGAAPLEFSNSVGYPLRDGLVFVHNVLVGMGLRKNIRIIASGKTVTGFDIISRLALGADTCNAARAMMMAIGCIQALRCNSNRCPTGVATQDPELTKGLDVTDKRYRVSNFHQETVKSVSDILGAMGLHTAQEVRPWHINRRTGPSETKHFGEIYAFLKDGDLLHDEIPAAFERSYRAATADSFLHVNELHRVPQELPA